MESATEENTQLVTVDQSILPSIIRDVEETKLRIIIAQKNPRRMVTVDEDVEYFCTKYKMAARAMYSYPKGGMMVTGASIHLAKEVASVFGHIDYGYREIAKEGMEVKVEAFCVDLQKNVKETRVFTVKLERKARGKAYPIYDEREQYELIANKASRRVRACIIGIIPSYVFDRAIEICDKTLHLGDGKRSFDDTVKVLISSFKVLGVQVSDLEERLGHNIESIIANEVVELGKVYTSLKDGMSDRADWFKSFKKVDSKIDKLDEKL